MLVVQICVQKLEDRLMFHWLRSITNLFHRPGKRTSSPAPPERVRRRWRSLTMRQRQVAALVGLNFTYQQIGDILYISPHTARSHTRNVLRKLHIKDKAELCTVLSILEEQGVINLQAYGNQLDHNRLT